MSDSKRAPEAEEVARYYRDNPRMVSSPFGGVDRFDRALWDRVVGEMALDFDGKRVLDVGCGRGFLSEFFAEKGAEYFGADLVASDGRKDFPFVVAEGGRLPFGAGEFDALLCLDALEHFPSIEEAAAEFRRVLRPEGFVFLSVPNYANVAGIVKWCSEHIGGYERNSWAPFGRWEPQAQEQFITPRLIRRSFARAGFDRFEYRGLDREAILGIFPWVDHPKMPDFIRYRLSSACPGLSRSLIRLMPTLSLHLFWKIAT